MQNGKQLAEQLSELMKQLDATAAKLGLYAQTTVVNIVFRI